ncbi:MAG: hypothetical protein L6R36_007285 [Xanthoria steineri]|nr:MAG: hypothetical protein L6R36_007285 [Xanthoria steineri]
MSRLTSGGFSDAHIEDPEFNVGSSIYKITVTLHSFKMTTRLTYRRRNPYNTRSNKVRVIKTPGGKLQYQHLKKRGSPPKCGDCGIKLPGIPALRPREYATISRPKKTVQRAYGGSRCANCVKDRVVRAFLIEEQKIVKKVLKESQQKKK